MAAKYVNHQIKIILLFSIQKKKKFKQKKSRFSICKSSVSLSSRFQLEPTSEKQIFGIIASSDSLQLQILVNFSSKIANKHRIPS
jgi:hypothetical protein